MLFFQALLSNLDCVSAKGVQSKFRIRTFDFCYSYCYNGCRKEQEVIRMERFVTDERTGLKYELVGDYYLIAGDDEPEEDWPIGVWGSGIC